MHPHRNSKSRANILERLEARQFLSAAQIDFANFASTTGLVTNGFGGGATTTSNALELTDGAPTEARSALYGTKVPINSFTSNFSFQIAQGQAGVDGLQEADGFAFVIDNGATGDLGGTGSDLGYEAGTFGANSVAIEFNTYNNGSFGSTVGFTSAGNAPSTTQPSSPVDFHSGDTIDATVTYNGTLAVTLTDTTTSQTFSTSEVINLPTVLGAQTAYVGFTGGTGNDDSVQSIKEWDFTGAGLNVAPTINTVAASSPTVVTTTSGHLTVAATSNSGGTLSYAWSVLHAPPGAAAPTFTPNGTAGSNSTVVHYHKAGTYIFRTTVTDSNGGSTVSDVLVIVKQTPTQIKIEPHKPSIVKKHTLQFTGTVEDQFGHPLETQPGISYAIVSGSGGIGATTGLYTASGSTGHLVVSADADDLTGIAGAVVVS